MSSDRAGQLCDEAMSWAASYLQDEWNVKAPAATAADEHIHHHLDLAVPLASLYLRAYEVAGE